MGYSKLEQAVIDLATPIADMELCYIYDVEYVKEAGVRFLRVYADKQNDKITLDECEAISRKLSDLLDETELIDDNYYLEVSSPGAARRLKTQKHFEMYIGKIVEISLYKAIGGTKKLMGTLESYNNGEVVVNIDGEGLTLKKEDYGKINLFFDIDEILKNAKNNDDNNDRGNFGK
jgi:ribosome maturation factor RimP